MTSLTDYLDTIRVVYPSLVTAAALGIAGGIVGTFVLLRREALVALAMPQVVAVGAALGMAMPWQILPPEWRTLVPALGAVIIAVLLLAWSRRQREGNWLLPSLYIGGLSLSFLIIAHSGEHVIEMQNLFTGMDVTMTPRQMLIASPVLLATGALCAILWRRWLLLAQAPAIAEAAGRHTNRWETLFLCILAVILLIGTSNLGAVMVVAVLFLPAATALPWAKRIPAALLLSMILSLIFLLAGLILSIEFSLPLSQSVGGVGFCCLVISHAAARVLK
ncbi:MAG TPA: metal ABC transporter permease [Tepidisphaeraceae bacterium]|jgi:zinc/manganese transport system permease protein|nr:metal ABC transporter permease [Tepidisphaeraceae bacterium]